MGLVVIENKSAAEARITKSLKKIRKQAKKENPETIKTIKHEIS